MDKIYIGVIARDLEDFRQWERNSILMPLKHVQFVCVNDMQSVRGKRLTTFIQTDIGYMNKEFGRLRDFAESRLVQRALINHPVNPDNDDMR